jgi:hypothetical protein
MREEPISREQGRGCKSTVSIRRGRQPWRLIRPPNIEHGQNRTKRPLSLSERGIRTGPPQFFFYVAVHEVQAFLAQGIFTRKTTALGIGP